MICQKQQELIVAAQRHLAKLADLARAQEQALNNRSENTWLAIDKEIETTIGEKERALGALRQHQEEHGC
jgi:hypothetical protein